VGPRVLFDRNWVIPVLVILIVILAVETVILVVFVVESAFGGRQFFPGLTVRNVQAGCSTLAWTPLYTTATNRTLIFKCPGTGMSSYALKSNPFAPGFFSEIPYYQLYGTTPTFTLPAGYIGLWLTTIADCSYPNGVPSYMSIPLVSGQEVVVGGETYLYYYCAVIDNSVGKPAGFTIDWSPGTPPIYRPAPFKLSASPTETVASNATANYTITVTSLNGWTGNVSVDVRGGYTLGIPAQFGRTSVIVKVGGSNTTTLSQPTCYPGLPYCAPRGINTILIDGDAACISRVMGICMDQYNEVTLSIQINIV
jgi:hypothetical protein